MKFRVFSDIHLDFDVGRTRLAGTPELWEPKPLESDSITTLILAGDIWRADKSYFTAEWLNSLSSRFKAIVVVLGNHDYWGSEDWQREPYKLQEQLASNIHVLEKRVINIDGIRIGGATLWTNIDGYNPIRMLSARTYTNDFKYIPGMTSETWVREFDKTVSWLLDTKVDILITHYVPSNKFCHPRFVGEVSSCLFNSELAEFIQPDRMPKVWIFGHTHDSYNEEYLGTKFICNPRGYLTENINGFNQESLYVGGS